jgi:hypothetical protein
MLRDAAVENLKNALVRREWDDNTLGAVVDSIVDAAVDRVAGDPNVEGGVGLRDSLKRELGDHLEEMKATEERMAGLHRQMISEATTLRDELQALLEKHEAVAAGAGTKGASKK